MPMLDIKNLTLEIDTGTSRVKALDKVSLTVNSSEIRALVGESGSGKSLIVSAISGSLPSNWHITADRMSWQGQSLLSMSSAERREVMRRDIAVVFQHPISALDPSATLGEQLEESIPDEFVEGSWFWQRKQSRRSTAISTLHKVGIKQHQQYLSAYPHQISTDIGQKFMIAMALISQPKLLIADDPTRGMETTTKTQLLKLFTRLNQTKALAILFVSHDLLAIASMSHTMTVLYCGQTVESGNMKHLRKRPLHPYTKALLDSAPSFRNDLPPKSTLPTLPGTIPTLQHLPIGCRLGPRCPRAQRDCVITPVVRRIHDHNYSCHFPLHMEKL
ncbi:ATP-binding cassette domain-containing protein [Alteromonas aestuariivivens]|uniref:ATP-binding cassette domain-containing protein n=1 Tax=Alteromonas aestuariivivens TaxID=1938339 RepID=A0A3D8M6E7_9ALTE|nr:oligopeptide/dipeptide ABC transporter ATP-binding protein [Alteromonas aestuariivivens]RDV25114.1 ATP-binding cassette domain-containing protein [Alteromonas aestuariivivens]